MKRFYTILLTITALLSGSAIFNAAQAENITVNTFEELQTALSDPDTYDTIFVSTRIEIPVVEGGVTLNGQKTDGSNSIIQVATPYINEDGTPNTNPSKHGCLCIAKDAVVHLNYLTIMGGGKYPMLDTSREGTTLNIEYYIAAVQNGRRDLINEGTKEDPKDGGTLYMDHCTIQRSERGLYNYHAQTIMTNCKLIRNTGRFGAGALNEDGILIMDGCSFSENRSTRDGGALESKESAKTYLNNTIMANNIGGLAAINNNRNASCYFMNCTVTGNMSYNGGKYSVYNSSTSGDAYIACNSIITNNKYFDAVGSDQSLSEKDIQNTAAATIKLYNCITGTNTGDNITNTNYKKFEESADIFQNNINGSIYFARYKKADGTTAYYTGGYYYYYANGYTPAFNHTGLVHESNGTISAPLKLGSPAATGGCKTYFKYEINETSRDDTKIYMAFENSGTLINIGTDNAQVTNDNKSTCLVDKFANGKDRVLTDATNIVIGSSPVVDTEYRTLTLVEVPYGACKVNGATLYGDSYEKNTSMNVQVVELAPSSHPFQSWTKTTYDSDNKEIGTETITDASISFNLEYNTKLTPNFNLATYTIEYELNGGAEGGKEFKDSYTALDEEYTIPTPVRSHYTFIGWTGSNGTKPQKTVTITPGDEEGKAHEDREYTANWTPNKAYPFVNDNYVPDEYMYGTYYNANDWFVLPAGVEAYTATLNEDKTILTMHLYATPGQCIPVQCPVILKASKATATIVTNSKSQSYVTLTCDPEASKLAIPENNDLNGVHAATAIKNLSGYTSDASIYVLSNKTTDETFTGIGFYKLASSVTTMPANKAYVMVTSTTSSAPIRRLPFDFSAVEETEETEDQNVATDIDQISNEQLQMSNKLLIDGHLYIIRGAHMYNAQGQLVK